MRSESPLFQIVSLLMLVGPIYLFWYIDWYWIVGYYNLFFTYSALTLYKSYNRDSNYRRKYHPIIYLGLPLILNFVGLLISLLNGFEEIRKDEEIDKKESKEQELKESEVSFDTDQEWEIEKDYLKNPSFKFRKIENGNIVSINWIYGFDKVYDYGKAGENIYKHRVPFYWYEEEENLHVIVFRIIDVRLGKKFIDTLISLNGGEYSFKKIENIDGWEYLHTGDLFNIGILPDHMCVRINKIDSFTSVSDDLKYGINENDKKLRELIKGASKIFYNEGEGPSNGRICVRTTDENYWAYAFYDNISDSIDYFRKIVSNYEKNHDVFKYKDEVLDEMIKGVGIKFKSEQFELLLINENVKYKFYILPPGGFFTGKWS